MRTRIATIVAALALCVQAQADGNTVNSKSGISLDYAGTRGVDFCEEHYYHNPTQLGLKTVYVRSGTEMSAWHNTNNIAGDPGGSDSYVSVSTNVGTIKFKVDGDLRWELYPTTWSTWVDGVSFDDLTYSLYGDSAVAVVGSTGDNGVTLSLTTKTNYYHRGIEDSFGDEWHVLTLADDDSATRDGDAEFDSSDGKIVLFVVNPTTPCLTVFTNSPAGQFYTTPPKKYFIPEIYAQTSFITSNTSIRVTDIYGSNVVWRINGGSWSTNASGSDVAASSFSGGTNVLEYYCLRGSAPVKSRTVVKDPSHPSASEAHGDRLWVSAAVWTNEVRPRLLSDSSLLAWVNNWRGASFTTTRADENTGKRTLGGGMEAALVARIDGFAEDRDVYHTYAEYAKMQLFDTAASLDPVGAELYHSNLPKPAAEILYRGYYDVNPILSAAAAYDVLIGRFKDSDYAGGITAIEDAFIRDRLASWVHMCSLVMYGYDSTISDTLNECGMWQTARNVGAAMVAFVMPNYRSDVFGASGMDGSAGIRFSALQSQTNSWRDLFFDGDVPMDGFPDVHRRIGVNENMITSDGSWNDRIGYSSTALMGRSMGVYYSLLRLAFPERNLDRYDLLLENAAAGELYGTKFDSAGDYLATFRSYAGLQNAWFPQFRVVAQPTMLSLDSTSYESLGRQLNSGGALWVLWYDHDIGAEPDTTPPTISSVSADPSASGATVAWTTDEAATSGLQWGLTTSYTGGSTNAGLVTSHTRTAGGLSPGTLYHFRVISADASGNTSTTSDATFTTAAAGEPSVAGELRFGTLRVGTMTTK